MPSTTSRVRLRQAVLVAGDLEQSAARLRTAGRQLQRRGDGGYMVIFDIAGKDDFEGARSRALRWACVLCGGSSWEA
jgi:hypothetical protein